MGTEYKHIWDDFCCEYSVRKRSWRMNNMHYHNSYELFVMISGETELMSEDRIISMKKGDIALYKKNTLHRNNGGAQHSRFALNFSDRFLEHHFTSVDTAELLVCFEHEKLSVPEEDMGYIKLLLKRMTKPGGEFAYLAALLTALSDIAKRPADENADIKGKHGGVETILEHINRNFSEINSVDDIADAVHMSKSYLCQKFKRETSMTITEYLNSVRVRNACGLLSCGLGVSETALRCGYSAASYFCKTFKKIVKMTPGEYRKLEYETNDLFTN